MKRRSFLALIAGALAVEPARLIQAAAPAQIPPAPWPLAPWTIENYIAWEKLIVESGKETNQELFLPPLPDQLSIQTMKIYFDPCILVADMEALLDALWLRVKVDGHAIMDRCPIYTVTGPCAGLTGAAPSARDILTASETGGMAVTPAIVPREEFRVQLAGPAVRLSRPAEVQIVLGGTVRLR
jgi:hypothetical protein